MLLLAVIWARSSVGNSEVWSLDDAPEWLRKGRDRSCTPDASALAQFAEDYPSQVACRKWHETVREVEKLYEAEYDRAMTQYKKELFRPKGVLVPDLSAFDVDELFTETLLRFYCMNQRVGGCLRCHQ